ncbi:mCG145190, partial [Mus musculus]
TTWRSLSPSRNFYKSHQFPQQIGVCFVYRDAFRWHLAPCSWWGHNVESTESCEEFWTAPLVLLLSGVETKCELQLTDFQHL